MNRKKRGSKEEEDDEDFDSPLDLILRPAIRQVMDLKAKIQSLQDQVEALKEENRLLKKGRKSK